MSKLEASMSSELSSGVSGDEGGSKSLPVSSVKDLKLGMLVEAKDSYGKW